MAVFLGGVALRVFFLLVSANNGGDALDRLAKTEAWLENLDLRLFFEVWPPLHFWLMGAAGALLGHVELGGRLLSLLLGSGSLWLVWRIARREFGDLAGLFALCAITFYTLHIGYSTTTSAEVPYLFFSLAGLDLFLHQQRDGSWLKLFFSGLCFTLAAAIRYEAWVLMAAVALLLIGRPWHMARSEWWNPDRLRRLLMFCCTAGSWPLFWMIHTWSCLGHPLYFLQMQSIWVPIINFNAQTPVAYRLLAPPAFVILSLSPLMAAAALYGLAVSLRKYAGRVLAFVLVFLSAIQLYQILTESMWSAARFTITQGTLLAIFAGVALGRLARRLSPRWSTATLCAAVALLLLVNLAAVLALSEARHNYSENFSYISPRLRFPHYIQDAGDFLRARITPGEPIVIDNYNVELRYVAVASGLRLRPGKQVLFAVNPKRERVREFLDSYRPRYVVYSPLGELRKVLPLPPDCSPAKHWDAEFRCVFHNEFYSIFEVIYR